MQLQNATIVVKIRHVIKIGMYAWIGLVIMVKC